MSSQKFTFRMGGGSYKDIIETPPRSFLWKTPSKSTPLNQIYRVHRDKDGVLGVTSLESIDWDVLDSPRISKPPVKK